MDQKQFLLAVNQIAEEKGIAQEQIVETLEMAIAAAYKKDYGKRGQRIRAEFSEVSGDAKFFLVKDVVDETLREFVEPGEENENSDEEIVEPVRNASHSDAGRRDSGADGRE